jgi:hypothetical protein
MTGASAICVGVVGAMTMETFDVMVVIRRLHTWPWRLSYRPNPRSYLAAVVIRLASGASAAFVIVSSNHSVRPFIAFLVGLTAPLLLERVVRQLPLFGPEERGYPAARTAMIEPNPAPGSESRTGAVFGSLRRDGFPYQDNDAMPAVEQGREPPYAKVSLEPLEARVITALSCPEIEEGLAVDTGIALSRLREVLATLQRRGYVSANEQDRGKYRLTDTGSILRKRLGRQDRGVVVSTHVVPRRRHPLGSFQDSQQSA